MATIKKRITISLPGSVEEAIAQLAKRDQLPQATKAAELLRLAIENEEDEVWDSIAASRDKQDTKFIVYNKT